MRQAEIIDVRRWSAKLRDTLAMTKLFVMVSGCTMMTIVLLVLAGIGAERGDHRPMSPLKGVAMTMSAGFFGDMLKMEIPYYDGGGSRQGGSFSPAAAGAFLLQLLTHVNPYDPRSLLAAELPGMRGDQANVLYSGSGASPGDAPVDLLPGASAISPAPESPAPTPAPSAPPSGQSGTGAAPGAGEKLVFIYHSHNRESYLPELKSKGITDPDLAYDAEVNVGLVGKRLQERLEDKGIGTAHSTTDYPSEIKGFNYAKSYAYSRGTVQEALAMHPKARLILDIHRDSLRRERTTATIGGVDYAQIYFVIGKKNPHWEQNSKLAEQLHAILEKNLPGLSKGVYGKSTHGNAEYNQSLSPHNLLVEIGGPDNTLEELYRATDALAAAVAELLAGAVPAGNPQP
ncbi:stage II sporulation protein P [Paenibacillus thermoaerophilus]|uniref:Stage II sporulation protein P n=1 Tax=Paenibacillus thermoaerophilus TaxID=1215385 RepID=A0ABW2V187_9BACL|nr:stage II sporulation protein P [Paenibacillus thermoaerophilus]TMV18986.1 stage II sporulation protein P [Paenibacillus thermoaerophilus]